MGRVSIVVVATVVPSLLLLCLFGYVAALFARYHGAFVPVRCTWQNTTIGPMAMRDGKVTMNALITLNCSNLNPYELDIATPEPGQVTLCEPEPGRTCSKSVDFGSARVESHILPPKGTAIAPVNVTVFANLTEMMRMNSRAEKELISIMEVNVVATAKIALLVPGATFSHKLDAVERCGFALGHLVHSGPPTCANSKSELLQSIEPYDSKTIVPFDLDLDPKTNAEVEHEKATFFATLMSISGVLGLLLLFVAIVSFLNFRICETRHQQQHTVMRHSSSVNDKSQADNKCETTAAATKVEELRQQEELCEEVSIV